MVPRDAEWVFVPLEFIIRHYLAGSACAGSSAVTSILRCLALRARPPTA